MAERKCIEPSLVEKSGGRATCPDNFNIAFSLKGKCYECPKVSSVYRLDLSRRASVEQAVDVIYMKNLLNDISHKF